MKYIHYLGVILLTIIPLYTYGLLWMILNIIVLYLTTYYLIKIKKAQKFTGGKWRANKFIGDYNPILLIFSLSSLGIFFCIYLLRRFHKYPLTINTTEEELDKKINRNNKINSILK